MIMKRLIVLLLVMTLLMAGCGNAKPEDVAGTVQPMQAEAVPEEKTVSMGRLEGGNYVNEYTGYGCMLDSSWQFSGAEELQEMPENVAELIKGTELGDNYDAINQFTDMLAENAEQLQTINVLYRKCTMQDRLQYAMMSESEIIDGVLGMQDSMKEAYMQAGFEVTGVEKVTVTFLGEERQALRTETITQGVPYITLQIFDYHLGQYVVTLTLASFLEDTTEQMLDLFYEV